MSIRDIEISKELKKEGKRLNMTDSLFPDLPDEKIQQSKLKVTYEGIDMETIAKEISEIDGEFSKISGEKP